MLSWLTYSHSYMASRTRAGFRTGDNLDFETTIQDPTTREKEWDQGKKIYSGQCNGGNKT